jgi:hypothetical protein
MHIEVQEHNKNLKNYVTFTAAARNSISAPLHLVPKGGFITTVSTMGPT